MFIIHRPWASRITCLAATPAKVHTPQGRKEFYIMTIHFVHFEGTDHELGHVMGLQHCDDPGCVMYFSNRLSDTDRKASDFCETCQRKLQQ